MLNPLKTKPLLVLFSFAVFSAGMVSCGSDRSVTETCSNGVCRFSSGGDKANFDTTTLNAGEEYVLVFLSQAKPKPGDATHSVFIESTYPSAAVEKKEAALIQQLRQKARISSSSGLSHSDNLSLPPRNSYSIAEDESEFYVPAPEDYYQKEVVGQTTEYWVHSPTGAALSGTRFSFEDYSDLSGVYSLKFNTKDFNANSKQNLSGSAANYLEKLSDCLNHSLENTFSYLGRPVYQLNQSPGVRILLTRFQGGFSGGTLGLFSSTDRFTTEGKKTLSDSNKGEILYLSPNANTSIACGTASHEYQHLLSFDFKVLAQMPESKRFDMSVQESKGLYPEVAGLNEAYSHMVEMLSGEQNYVSQHMYRFLNNPQGATFALESTLKSLNGALDPTDNIRSRGLNTLFLSYVIKRMGGSLNSEDPKTQNILRALIHSPDIGFKNIAKQLDLSEDELFQEFFVHFSKALYSESETSDFLPPLENAKNQSNLTQGVRILNRSALVNEVSFGPSAIHPLQIPIDPLMGSETQQVQSQSILMYRYIAPQQSGGKSKISVSANGKPFLFFAIRVR